MHDEIKAEDVPGPSWFIGGALILIIKELRKLNKSIDHWRDYGVNAYEQRSDW
jgi:hypothetical protein